jgi:hypothetical protein
VEGIAAGVIAALFLIGQGAASVHAEENFTITGEVGGLYPGAETTLNAQVTNPQPFPIRVTSVAVRVRDASPGCPASMLEIRGSENAVEVPPGATRSVRLDVRMDRSAPDACQGATWPLEFTGTATGEEPTTGASPSDPTGPGGFAYTGANLVLLFVVMVALAAAGVLSLRQARRRRRTKVTT